FGQGIGFLFILPVRARQPLRVLPQVLRPGVDNKELHITVCCLPVPEYTPLRRPGPQPRLAYASYGLKERLLILRGHCVAIHHDYGSIFQVWIEDELWLPPVHSEAGVHAPRITERPE